MLILLLAIMFIGVAAALGLRALAATRFAAPSRLADIEAYGFVAPAAPAKKAKTPLRVRVDALAMQVGNKLQRRIVR